MEDPEEQHNLAGDPEHTAQLKKMKRTLTRVLKQFPERPYGEFIPGGNARGPGEAKPMLKRLKEFYGADPKSKKQRTRKRKR